MRVSEAARDTSFSGLFSAASAREVLGQVPARAHAVRVLTAGHWGLADWIEAWIERCEAAGRPVEALDLTCWATSVAVASVVGDWLARFDGRVRLVIDSFMLTRGRARRGDTPFERMVEILGAERWRAGVTHWKGAVLHGSDVVLVSTGNLEVARRSEAMMADVDPAWAAEVGRWFDAAFEHVRPTELVPKEAVATRNRLRSRMNSDLWRAFDLACSARCAELQGLSVPPPETETDMPARPLAPAAPPAEDSHGPLLSEIELADVLRGKIQARLQANAMLSVAESGELVRQLRELTDLKGAARRADLRLAGEVCDVMEAAILPRSVAERRAVAERGLRGLIP